MTSHTLSLQNEEKLTHRSVGITSPAFKENGFIPKLYACGGKNISPALNVDHIPAETESLAIVVDDPDAPNGLWVHWVMWNVPVTRYLKENDAPGTQGMNDFGRHTYNGPCPPSGTHHYHFKVYALDCKLEIPVSSNNNDLQRAMNGHILGFGELTGLYRRD